MPNGRMITESRNRDVKVSATRIASDGSVNQDPLFATVRERQVTTSYRSGKGQPSFEDQQVAWNTTTREGRLALISKFDSGHPFDTLRQWDILTRPRVDVRSGNGKQSFIGPLIPSFTGTMASAFPSVPVMSVNDIAYYGSKAIADTRPTAPSASLAVTMGEFFREGLPSPSELARIKERADIVRQAGSEYLNYQFGWVPLLNDVIKIGKSLVAAKQTIEQYYRDSGRVVRRRRTLHTETSTRDLLSEGLVVPSGYPIGLSSSYFSSSQLKHQVDEVTSTRIAFRGAYSYVAKSIEGSRDPLERMHSLEQQFNRLFGTRVTPGVLWDLAPWSWFVDWFGSIGDALAPIGEFDNDNLVLRYGYLVKKTRVARRFTTANLQWNVGGPQSCTRFVISERKQRVQATPFGFGLNPEAFSAQQWTTLAALLATGGKDVVRGR